MLRIFNTHGAYTPFMFRSADAEGSGGNDEAESADAGTNTDANTGNGISPDIQKLIEAQVAASVAGLQKKNAELIGKEKRLREELAAAKSKPDISEEEFKKFQELQARIERDELLRDLTEGKTDEVIDRVTRRTRVEMEAKLSAEAEARRIKEAEALTWQSRYEQTLVNVEITKAAAGAVKPQYQDLVAKLVGERVKLVDGAIRVVNAEGEIEMTANGAKPLSVTDYIETLRSSYSDLFVTSAGGGASGSTRKSPGTSNKIAVEQAENLSFEDYKRLRSEGKI